MRFIPSRPIKNKAISVQIMTWHQTGSAPFLNRWWPILLSHVFVTRPQWVNYQQFNKSWYFDKNVIADTFWFNCRLSARYCACLTTGKQHCIWQPIQYNGKSTFKNCFYVKNWLFLWETTRCDIWNSLITAHHVRVVYNQWHDDVIKWKHVHRYWPFVRGIHR